MGSNGLELDLGLRDAKYELLAEGGTSGTRPVVEGDALGVARRPWGFRCRWPVGRTAGDKPLTIEIAQAELSGSVG